MNRMKRFSLVVGVTALALTGSAVQDAVVLKRVAKVGDSMTYKMVVEADFSGTTLIVNGKTIEKVIKIEDNGNIHTESKQTDMKIKIGDDEMDAPEEGATIYINKPTGEVVELKGDGIDASYYRMANITVFRIPDEALKPGMKWSHEFKADSKTGAASAKADYEVLGFEKVGSWDAVKVKHVFRETEGSEPAKSTGTIWINVKDGSLLKVDAKQEKVPIPGMAPMDMKIIVERTS